MFTMKKLFKLPILAFVVCAFLLLVYQQGNEYFRYTVPDKNALSAIEHNCTKIYTIQGEAHISPLCGKTVKTVPGIVTGIRYSKKKPVGFYMQDKDGDGNTRTSDGMYVHCGVKNVPHSLTIGDAVTVTGTVIEYVYTPKNAKRPDQLSTTQITIASSQDVTILSSGNPLPEPVEITASNLEKPVFTSNLAQLDPEHEAIDYYESLEGMRVKIVQPQVISPPYKGTHYIAPFDAKGFTPRGALIYNSYDSTGRVCVYPYACFADKKDAHVERPIPTIGDRYEGDIVGVLSYGYGNYQIEITAPLPPLIRSSIVPEKSRITFDANTLNIASYNLENYSIAWGKRVHSSQKTPKKRAVAFARQFVNELKCPDIICLAEIQDDSADTDDSVVSAEKTLDYLIDTIASLRGCAPYKWISIAPENNKDGGAPGANVRCCYLYRTDRIELVKDSDGDFSNSTCMTEAKIAEDGLKLIQNPSRIGVGNAAFKRCRKSLVAHFKFKGAINGGKDFFVINNHFTSKRSDSKIWGMPQPAARASENKRLQQVHAVTDFIQRVKKERPHDARIISAGDYNDFWFSKPIAAFKALGMKNVVEVLPEYDRYTYLYDGHAQLLDNMLLTDNIAIDYADILHINAEFSPKERLSDHDPLFAQLRL